jgi:hypothetical protein
MDAWDPLLSSPLKVGPLVSVATHAAKWPKCDALGAHGPGLFKIRIIMYDSGSKLSFRWSATFHVGNTSSAIL